MSIQLKKLLMYSHMRIALRRIPVNLNTKRNSNHNRYKQNFLADSGYSSNKNKRFLKNKGYTPVIKYNKRNTKSKKKISVLEGSSCIQVNLTSLSST